MARKAQVEYRRRKAQLLQSGNLSTGPAVVTTQTTSAVEVVEDVDSDDEYMDEEIEDDQAPFAGSSSQGTQASKMKTMKEGGFQVLPVAILPEDWEGEAEDGATYLALALRANEKLPKSVRVEDPYRSTSIPPPSLADTTGAGPSRHGALPKESWITSFSSHFQSYRKHITASWPPSPLPPYPADAPPFPTHENRHEWIYYICGYGRGQISSKEQKRRNSLGKSKWSPSRPNAEDEEVEMALEPGPNKTDGDEGGKQVVEEDDEEAWMSNVQPPTGSVMREEEVDDLEGEDDMELEEETARHQPREPTVAIVSHLSTRQIITILIQISLHLSKRIDHLSSLLNLSLIDSPPPANRTPHALPNIPPTLHPNPFPSILARWTFALLSILDSYLPSDDTHHIREFARVIMRVGGWRYIRAVQANEVGVEWEIGQKGVIRVFEGGVGTEGSGGGENGNTDESGVDETLGRCWMVVLAISAGWAQHDLLDSLETLFK